MRSKDFLNDYFRMVTDFISLFPAPGEPCSVNLIGAILNPLLCKGLLCGVILRQVQSAQEVQILCV
jgi:hypothetical protein